MKKLLFMATLAFMFSACNKSKDDFNDFIEDLEDDNEFECKSDFWN